MSYSPRPALTELKKGWGVRYWYGVPPHPRPVCTHQHRTKDAAIRCFMRVLRREVAAMLADDAEWWEDSQ